MRFGLTNFIPQTFTEFPAVVSSLSMAVSKCQPVIPAGVQLWLLLPLGFPPTESSAGWVCLPRGARPKWISHWRNNPLVPRSSRWHAACCQLFWPCSWPWICHSQGSSSQSCSSSEEPQLSLKEKASSLLLHLQMHSHHFRGDWVLLAGSPVQSLPDPALQTRGWRQESPASPLHPANPFPEYLPKPWRIDHLSLQRQPWPSHTLCLNPGTSALSTRLSLWHGNHEGNSFDEEPNDLIPV